MSYLDLFHHQITGPDQGRRWVFVHGLMGYSNNWRKIAMGLEKSERVLVYDQRGHGRSMKPEAGYSPEDYSEDLYKITEELGWDRFILVGHSMGGRNVLNFAYRHPEKLSHLVIEDIGPEALGPAAVDYYEQLLGAVPTPFRTRQQAREFFQNEFAARVQTRGRADVLGQFLYANLEEKSDGTVDWRFSKRGILETVSLGRSQERWQEVEALQVPTLWIRGENSQELSRETFDRILKLNGLISGVEVPDAGHWVHSDQPALFLQALKDFVGGF